MPSLSALVATDHLCRKPSTSNNVSPTIVSLTNFVSLRNNFGPAVGCRFKVSRALGVYRLGRIFVTGNTQSHTVGICTTDGTVLTSVSVTPSGTNRTFTYADCTPALLRPGIDYFLYSTETSGGDQWYDQSNSGQTFGDVTIEIGAFGSPGNFSVASNFNHSYVPPNMLVG